MDWMIDEMDFLCTRNSILDPARRLSLCLGLCKLSGCHLPICINLYQPMNLLWSWCGSYSWYLATMHRTQFTASNNIGRCYMRNRCEDTTKMIMSIKTQVLNWRHASDHNSIHWGRSFYTTGQYLPLFYS